MSESIDGNRDTRLSEQKYAKRAAKRLRDAKNMKKWPENRKIGLYEPKNAFFGPIFRFLGPPGMKMKQKRGEQWGPGYGPQAAAMHTPPHAANLFRCGRGPIQNPDVLLRNTMINEWCYRDDDR